MGVYVCVCVGAKRALQDAGNRQQMRKRVGERAASRQSVWCRVANSAFFGQICDFLTSGIKSKILPYLAFLIPKLHTCRNFLLLHLAFFNTKLPCLFLLQLYTIWVFHIRFGSLHKFWQHCCGAAVAVARQRGRLKKEAKKKITWHVNMHKQVMNIHAHTHTVEQSATTVYCKFVKDFSLALLANIST